MLVDTFSLEPYRILELSSFFNFIPERYFGTYIIYIYIISYLV